MFEQLTRSLDMIVQQTQANLDYIGYILSILWGFFFLCKLEPRLLYLGIMPRTTHGLMGIVFAPVLHANFNHLFFNSIPLVVLSNFILIQGLPYFICVTTLLTIMSGFLIWCFAKPGIHIGASALITGYWALLVSNIFQQGTSIALMLGALSIYYFAGIFLGVFPGKKGVSWEGHLFGLISGIALSFFLKPAG